MSENALVSDGPRQYAYVLESPGHWYVEMKVQTSDDAVHHGTMQLTASLDGHSETTTFGV